MTFLIVLVLLVGIIWLAARVSDLGNELKSLRRDLTALERRLTETARPPANTGQGASAASSAAPDVSAPVSTPSDVVSGFSRNEPVVSRKAPEPAPVSSRSEAPPAAPKRLSTADSLERLIGGRWLLYIGMATILIGASYFVKLALDNEWITPAMRIVVGTVVGLLLVVAGPLFRARGYAVYGQILAGGGIAILYLCVYAAFNYYALLGSTAAFALMVLITGAAATLADREGSQGLALMAVGGGFLTPFLVSSGRDAQVTLFTYDAVLVGGTMLLARRRNWPALNAVSFALTVATLAVWADAYYRADRWLTTFAFLTLFVAMFVYIRHESHRWGTEAARYVAHLLILAPVLYHLFSLVILSDHGSVLLGYLVVATAAGLSVNARADAAPLRLVLWFAIMLPFFAWAADHRSWPVTAIGAVGVAIYAMHAAAQAVVAARERSLGGFDVALLYVSAIGLYLSFEIALEHRRVAVLPVVAVAIAAWYAGLAVWLRERFPAVRAHAGVLAAAFGSIAVARQFDGPAKPVGWAVLASGLFWLGLRESTRWLRVSGALLLSLAIGHLLTLLVPSAPVSQLVLLNPLTLGTLFVTALLFALAHAYHRAVAPGIPAPELRATLTVTGHLLLLTLITAEIRNFWSVQSPGRGGFLALHVMTSLAWAVYAVGLIVVGIRRQYAPIRYLAMAVLAVTILKVFLLDLAELEQAYRVLSAIGLGVLLLIASFLYQRFRPGE